MTTDQAKSAVLQKHPAAFLQSAWLYMDGRWVHKVILDGVLVGSSQSTEFHRTKLAAWKAAMRGELAPWCR